MSKEEDKLKKKLITSTAEELIVDSGNLAFHFLTLGLQHDKAVHHKGRYRSMKEWAENNKTPELGHRAHIRTKPQLGNKKES